MAQSVESFTRDLTIDGSIPTVGCSYLITTLGKLCTLYASVTRQYAVILVVTEKVTKVNWRLTLPFTTGLGMSALHVRQAVWLRGDQLPGNLLLEDAKYFTLLYIHGRRIHGAKGDWPPWFLKGVGNSPWKLPFPLGCNCMKTIWKNRRRRQHPPLENLLQGTHFEKNRLRLMAAPSKILLG